MKFERETMWIAVMIAASTVGFDIFIGTTRAIEWLAAAGVLCGLLALNGVIRLERQKSADAPDLDA